MFGIFRRRKLDRELDDEIAGHLAMQEEEFRRKGLSPAEARDADGNVVATATGKYVPLAPDRNREFVATLIDHPDTTEAARALKEAAHGVP